MQGQSWKYEVLDNSNGRIKTTGEFNICVVVMLLREGKVASQIAMWRHSWPMAILVRLAKLIGGRTQINFYSN